MQFYNNNALLENEVNGFVRIFHLLGQIKVRGFNFSYTEFLLYRTSWILSFKY